MDKKNRLITEDPNDILFEQSLFQLSMPQKDEDFSLEKSFEIQTKRDIKLQLSGGHYIICSKVGSKKIRCLFTEESDENRFSSIKELGQFCLKIQSHRSKIVKIELPSEIYINVKAFHAKILVENLYAHHIRIKMYFGQLFLRLKTIRLIHTSGMQMVWGTICLYEAETYAISRLSTRRVLANSPLSSELEASVLYGKVIT